MSLTCPPLLVLPGAGWWCGWCRVLLPPPAPAPPPHLPAEAPPKHGRLLVVASHPNSRRPGLVVVVVVLVVRAVDSRQKREARPRRSGSRRATDGYNLAKWRAAAFCLSSCVALLLLVLLVVPVPCWCWLLPCGSGSWPRTKVLDLT